MQMSDLARTVGFRDILAYPVTLEKHTQEIYLGQNYPVRIHIVDFGHMCARM